MVTIVSSNVSDKLVSISPAAAAARWNYARQPLEAKLETYFDLGNASKQFSIANPTYPYSETDATQERVAGNALMNTVWQGTVTVAPGTYRLPRRIDLTNKSNVFVDMTGATLITEHASDLFYLNQCSNVTLHGAAWDTTQLPYFQGLVTSVVGNAVSIALMERYTAELKDGGASGTRVNVFTPSGELVNFNQISYTAASVSGNVVTMTFDGVWDPTFANSVFVKAFGRELFKVGYVMAVEAPRLPCAAVLVRCADVTMSNVTIYTGGSSSYNQLCSGNTVYSNVRCTKLPYSNRLIVGQPTQDVQYSGNVVYEYCEFGLWYDDGIDLLGPWALMANQSSPTNVVVAMTGPYTFTGNVAPIQLTFRAYDTMSFVGKANVVSASLTTNAQVAAQVAQFVASYNQRPGGGTTLSQLFDVVIDAPLTIPQFATVERSDCRADSFYVGNCYFADLSAQGLLLQGATSGVVENTVVANGMDSGIHVGWSFFWYEGPTTRNIAIRNNVFRNTPRYHMWSVEDFAAIMVYGFNTLGNVTERLMSNIVVSNNVVIAPSVTAILCRNVDGLTVENNKIVSPAWRQMYWFYGAPMPPTKYAIDVLHCSNVATSNNVVDLRFVRNLLATSNV